MQNILKCNYSLLRYKYVKELIRESKRFYFT